MPSLWLCRSLNTLAVLQISKVVALPMLNCSAFVRGLRATLHVHASSSNVTARAAVISATAACAVTAVATSAAASRDPAALAEPMQQNRIIGGPSARHRVAITSVCSVFSVFVGLLFSPLMPLLLIRFLKCYNMYQIVKSCYVPRYSGRSTRSLRTGSPTPPLSFRLRKTTDTMVSS